MENMVTGLLEMQQQLRILHWQTKAYARHKAYGKTYDELGDLIDEFMEVHMGKYGRFELGGGAIQLKNLDEVDVGSSLNEYNDFLISFNEQLDSEKDSDLLNIRDEMMAKVNRLKYLLTLK